ncbi:uncharacterized protein LTR77_001994 [Saxophila tyrrhenica]|uniref:Uncharacterized protein n=1 Tax=Saxophila tyrrhenica TaxID=1690608 RepID=A0AAV9PI64_9PEZI|nr:hypothetical protein LTR77_001994 [Saxophila tyrrhenica]
MPPLDLTFGIELEFFAVHDGSRNAGITIFERLDAAGIPVTGHESDGALQEYRLKFEPYQRWNVHIDFQELTDTERSLLPDGWIVEPIEISSRKFPFSSPDWKSEVANVLQILREIEHEKCRIITNENFMPLRTCKNVFQLLTAFERHIDAYHLPERFMPPALFNPPDVVHAQRYHLPPSVFHRTSCDSQTDTHRIDDRLLILRLGDIENTRIIEQVMKIFILGIPNEHGRVTCGHNSSINFDNCSKQNPIMFGEEKYIPTGTIEFRGHAGTLDLLTILKWIAFTTHIVQYCHNTPDAEFMYFLTGGWDSGFTLCNLLSALNLPPEVFFDHANAHALIGVLPPIQTAAPVPAPEIAPLIQQNSADYARRSNPLANASAIARKRADKWYGIHPTLDVQPPSREEVREMLDKHLKEHNEPSVASGRVSEEAMLWARWLTLTNMYDRYEKEITRLKKLGKKGREEEAKRREEERKEQREREEKEEEDMQELMRRLTRLRPAQTRGERREQMASERLLAVIEEEEELTEEDLYWGGR